MDLGAALLERLKSASAVTDIVGDDEAARIFWVKRPQASALPALVLRQISSVPEAETVDDEGGMWRTRVQCDCLAKSHAVAWALAKAVGDVLIDEGSAGSGEDEMLFWNGDREGPIDLGEDTPQGFEHRAMLELVLRHTPAN